MTQEETKKLIKQAIAEYNKEHPCRLSCDERAMIHAQHEAMIEEGANHGTFRILFQWGVSVKDVTKQVRRFVIIALGLIALALGARAIFRG